MSEKDLSTNPLTVAYVEHLREELRLTKEKLRAATKATKAPKKEVFWTRLREDRGNPFRIDLVAYYEVNLSAMSDDYSPTDPNDPNAFELFDMWLAKARKEYSDGLVHISWYVQDRDRVKFENMPFQHPQEWQGYENFLTYYTWPQTDDGLLLDWLSLPIEKKGWNAKHASKGGFIEEATGWKPGILQPYVSIDTLRAGYEAHPNRDGLLGWAWGSDWNAPKDKLYRAKYGV